MSIELKPAIIFDIDNVLTRLDNFDRHQDKTDYVWFGEMLLQMNPQPWSTAIVQGLEATGIRVIFLTARNEDFRANTVTWLKRHLKVRNFKLLMRRAVPPDNRADWEVKKELYMEKIYGKYTVLCAFDDKEENINMYRDLGIVALHNIDGKF